MKVVIISHTYVSSINRDKWKVFARTHKDMELFVIIPARWPTHFFTTNSDLVSQESSTNCHFIPLQTSGAGNEIRYCYSPRAFIQTLKKIRPDLIHVEQGAGALSYFQAIISAKLAGIKPKFCFFTWVNWHHTSPGRLRMLWQWVERFNLKNSHGAVAGNHDAQKILVQQGLKNPVVVLPQLGINTSIFRPAQHENLHPSIMYVGRIVEEKGVLLLFKAFVKLHKVFPQWKLLFIGSGPLEKKLIDLTITAGMLDCIEFKPPVAHATIATLLQQASILVLPSYDTAEWREQFGHVLIEAMACKVPVLGSSAGEIPHVIGTAGLIFEQNNQADLEEKLTHMMQSSSLRKSLGEKGYQHVLHYYTHEIISDKTYAFWQQLLTQ